MNYLFFLVHPSKYHLFRNVINKLIADGSRVDVLIISKGNLESLVSSENWNYYNIFPKGRRIKGVNRYLSALIKTFSTIYKILKYSYKRKYDLFITDDLLTIIGRLKNVPSILFTDDDISAVPESVILLKSANYIISPYISNMGKYERKKIGYYGYKSLAHLHPNNFIPNRQALDEPVNKEERYFFIRCVSVTSTHDVLKKGIDDSLLKKLVTYLEKQGRVIINSERVLPAEFDKYVIKFNREDVAHYIAFAEIFISDSTTMCAEAAVLGVPAIEIDDWHADFAQYKDLNEKYGLLYGFKPYDEANIFKRINKLLNNKNLKKENAEKRKRLLNDSIDVSSFIYWILSEYSASVEKYFKDKNIQLRFK